MSADIPAILARLEAGLARLEARQTKLRTDVMKRIDRLQNTVTGTRDELRGFG